MEEEVIAANSRIKEIDSAVADIRRKIKKLRFSEAILLDEKKTLNELIKSKKKIEDGQEFRENTYPWSARIAEMAAETFQITGFRGMQEAAINCVLSGKDCILIMPTGAGKSLTYQLPCAYLQGLTVVVSPLVSLMEDQVMQVKSRNPDFPVACLHSQMNPKDTADILKRMLFPKKDENTLLLYVTPERMAKSKRFMSKLQKCWELKKLKLLAIDEVHCCSQWGHDFRTDYNYLGILRKQFTGVPIIGLTATAPKSVVTDVINLLNLGDNVVVFRDTFHRPNLRYKVHFVTSIATEAIGDLINEKYKNQSGIVYCLSIRESEEVAKRLVTDFGICAQAYHASLGPTTRSSVHARWATGDTLVIVATVAFGMGIDKPNVRFVIHHSMPKSLENYYQESGRAGRDGQPAVCELFFKFQDIFRQSAMVFSEKTGINNLYQVVEYCMNRTTCRRTLLEQHFCDTREALVSACSDRNQKCDNCSTETNDGATDISSYIMLMRDIIEKAQETDMRLTGNKLVEALHKREKTMNRGQLELLVAWCMCRNVLEEKYHFTPYSTIPYFVQGSFMSSVLNGSEVALLPDNVIEVATNRPTKRKRAD